VSIAEYKSSIVLRGSNFWFVYLSPLCFFLCYWTFRFCCSFGTSVKIRIYVAFCLQYSLSGTFAALQFWLFQTSTYILLFSIVHKWKKRSVIIRSTQAADKPYIVSYSTRSLLTNEILLEQKVGYSTFTSPKDKLWNGPTQRVYPQEEFNKIKISAACYKSTYVHRQTTNKKFHEQQSAFALLLRMKTVTRFQRRANVLSSFSYRGNNAPNVDRIISLTLSFMKTGIACAVWKRTSYLLEHFSASSLRIYRTRRMECSIFFLCNDIFVHAHIGEGTACRVLCARWTDMSEIICPSHLQNRRTICRMLCPLAQVAVRNI
jgi:hypothetical protein